MRNNVSCEPGNSFNTEGGSTVNYDVWPGETPLARTSVHEIPTCFLAWLTRVFHPEQEGKTQFPKWTMLALNRQLLPVFHCFRGQMCSPL